MGDCLRCHRRALARDPDVAAPLHCSGCHH
jgi:hypothetical protein